MIVVDTNVVAYLFIEGTQTQLAREVWALDPDWRLPEIWRDEYLNVLATFVRRGGATLESAERLWQNAVRLLSVSTRKADMSFALRLAVEHGLSAYDAQFVTLALSLGVSCVTEDRLLLRAFPQVAISMRAFCRA